MNQDSVTVSMTITLLVALICCGNIANAETTSPTQSETIINTGTVSRSAFTLAIDKREPTDQLTQLSNDHTLIYYFTELKDMTGQDVIHRWTYNEQTMAELKFTVGAPRWRVWSSKTLLPNWTGEWSVTVTNEMGQEISKESIEYMEKKLETQ